MCIFYNPNDSFYGPKVYNIRDLTFIKTNYVKVEQLVLPCSVYLYADVRVTKQDVELLSNARLLLYFQLLSSKSSFIKKSILFVSL